MKKRKYKPVSISSMVPYYHPSNIKKQRPEILIRNGPLKKPLAIPGISFEYVHRKTGEVIPSHIVEEIKKQEHKQLLDLLRIV